MSTHLDRALVDWPDWPLPLSAPPEVIEPLSAGRTNHSYRLRSPGLGDDLILRLHHPEPERLGIDRARERIITQRTAAAGIGRPVWHWSDDYSLFPFIEARTWTDAEFASPEERARLWPMIEQLATLRIDQPRRRYSDYLQYYWQQLKARGAVDESLRQAWAGFWPKLVAFDAADWTAGLVHHDLIPANVLDTGDRLVLIDWEYAALGHPDIDRWALDSGAARSPFVGELVWWINRLWEGLV